MPNDPGPARPAPDQTPPDAGPTDRDERRIQAFQNLIRGAIADDELRGTNVVLKLDAALRGDQDDLDLAVEKKDNRLTE